MSEEYDPSTESDLRRRAAWLLGMLVLVAALVVAIMVTVLGGSGDGGNNDTVANPDTSVASTSAPTSSTARSTSSQSSQSSQSAPGSSAAASTSQASTSSSLAGRASCPDKKPCALGSDVGNAAAAINAYRTKNGRKAVPIAVGDKAQKCALSNGSGCSGGWAETQVPKPDGTAAVQKILQFGKLLDSGVRSIQVGWAYDPGSKQYFFALIREN